MAKRVRSQRKSTRVDRSAAVNTIGDPDAGFYGEPRQLGGCTAGLHIFADDNATLLPRAVQAGAKEIQPPTEMFYGANSASVRDPYGTFGCFCRGKRTLNLPRWNAAEMRS